MRLSSVGIYLWLPSTAGGFRARVRDGEYAAGYRKQSDLKLPCSFRFETRLADQIGGANGGGQIFRESSLTSQADVRIVRADSI